ncbi:mannose-6-phosphate isomerase, class I [Micromonospora echinofusca]|uniref:mannose-6-phosphate isomerase n=1 Tax=Micromonospora echinofusca TaxID=47858 RepID=A0ABS3VSS6_MICEH|nr:mannose-6-phosphate isomerase, class I [Micromonospora echinofusca]MBO4207563.1 mannose-6-phosphate isomerase, class I [Micromonospora echinofusca]
MHLLDGPVRGYAWGSRSVIAELQGRPTPSDGPEAELWLGAHPGAPATLVAGDGRRSLLDVLTAEPGHWLGARVVERFGPRLPFLLKVLAAEAPLSLQAHPDAEQARAGYAAEQHGAGGHRNYADPYHKPELLVALSAFDALCGFRDPVRSAEVFDAFGVPALAPVVDALRGGVSGLSDAVGTLLEWPVTDRTALLDAVLAARPAPGYAPDAALARDLAGRYPGDPGVLVALLLNHVRLAEGEAIWMPAGNLHAYLHGAGVEIMASSDNVLRGGLTPKQVDVPELLRVLRFEVLDDPVVRAVPVAPGVVTWPVPVEDFALHRVTPADVPEPVRLALPGPRVVFCRAGKLVLDDGAGAVTLGPGQSAVGAAVPGALTVAGDGEAYVATAGLT